MIQVLDAKGFPLPLVVDKLTAYIAARAEARRLEAAAARAVARVEAAANRADEARWALNEADADDRPRTTAWNRSEAAKRRLYDAEDACFEARELARSARIIAELRGAELYDGDDLDDAANRAIRALGSARRRIAAAV